MIIINTSLGDIHLELDEAVTPITVANFIEYIHDGFYTDTIFHRVIDGFMIQGGGLNEAMEKKACKAPIKNEAKLAKLNTRGTIAMARTSDPDSATSQFFINLVDNAFLNYKAQPAENLGYCVFGSVVSGMDVVDAIGKTKTKSVKGHDDVPEKPILIYSMTIR